MSVGHAPIESNYTLLDSGAEKRVEQFGSAIIIRPYKRAIWKLGLPLQKWRKKAHAEFLPKEGWQTLKPLPYPWHCLTVAGTIELRLQNSSQVGLFPEHLNYLPYILESVSPKTKVLNLFAYTGAASVACLAKGAEVTHVDISRSCLNWARQNALLNIPTCSQLKTIQEDALGFLAKLKSKGSKFNLILSDPPAFSRISKNKQWQVHDIIESMIQDLFAVLAPGGLACITTHQLDLDHHGLQNIAWQNTPDRELEFSVQELTVREEQRPITLGCGHLLIAKSKG
jgi:23S rRNA (cytosine1962-C5)-methyltransferase